VARLNDLPESAVTQNRCCYPAFVFFCCTAAAAFSAAYVVREDPIYYWDFRGYWGLYAHFQDGISDFRSWLQGMIRDLRISEYNFLPVVPLQPFKLAFQGSRAGYIAAIASLYLVPVALLTTHLTGSLAKRFELPLPREISWLLVLTALSFPPFWIPTLRGYPDIVGCLPLVALSVLFLREDVTGRLPWKHLMVAGILLWLPFLMRKWYAYSLVALVIAAGTTALIQHFAHRRLAPERRSLFPWDLLRNFLVVGVISVLCATLVQRGLVEQALSTDYADIFRAYQVDFQTHVRSFYRHFGPLLLLFAGIGAVGGLFTRRFRVPTLFLVINALVLTALFTRTQEFGIHHFLPLAVWLFCLAALGLMLILGRLRNRVVLRSIALAIAGLFLLSFVNSFVRPVGLVSRLLPESRCYPLRSPNLEQYSRLEHDIRRVLNKGDRVAIFASSLSLNADILDSVAGGTLQPYFQAVSHIDKRDRFDLHSLAAAYAVSTAPAQTHVAPADQRVITIPAEEIFNGSGIGAAYVALSETYPMDGFVARVYRRTRAFTFAELRSLLESLTNVYPDWRAHYRFTDLIHATGFFELGDVGGMVSRGDEDQVLIHPGENRATRATYGFGRWGAEGLRQISLSVPAEAKRRCTDADGVKVRVSVRGEEVFSGIVAPDGLATDVAIPHPELEGLLSLVADKSGNLSCDWLHVRFVTGPL